MLSCARKRKTYLSSHLTPKYMCKQPLTHLSPLTTALFSFAEEDSADNVMYDEELRDSQKAQIKAATIHKLVERLTYHEYAGMPLNYLHHLWGLLHAWEICCVIWCAFTRVWLLLICRSKLCQNISDDLPIVLQALRAHGTAHRTLHDTRPSRTRWHGPQGPQDERGPEEISRTNYIYVQLRYMHLLWCLSCTILYRVLNVLTSTSLLWRWRDTGSFLALVRSNMQIRANYIIQLGCTYWGCISLAECVILTLLSLSWSQNVGRSSEMFTSTKFGSGVTHEWMHTISRNIFLMHAVNS